MCGIVGLYDFSGRPGVVSAELLSEMTAIVAHRGPDGEGIWLCVEDGVGLGNRRLAIVDRSAAGAQPMGNTDGTVQLTFNGEIYNHRLLRAELERRGHVFRSRSDTEAVLHAYEEWGLDCFSRFVGMWALALWDSGRKRLVLSRDRLGIKPLYYLVGDGQLRFASEIKALFIGSDQRPELDLEALSLYLTYLVVPGPHTLVQGVRKLPPGHVLTIGPGEAAALCLLGPARRHERAGRAGGRPAARAAGRVRRRVHPRVAADFGGASDDGRRAGRAVPQRRRG